MKYLRPLHWCALALSLIPSRALADDPSPVEWARHRIDVGLIQPLAVRRPVMFSRSRPTPIERRVRVTQTTLSRDAQSREFIPFAVDVRFGGNWRENDIIGCAYRANDDLFVKIGEAYFPAAILLGKPVEAVAGVCQAAPAHS